MPTLSNPKHEAFAQHFALSGHSRNAMKAAGYAVGEAGASHAWALRQRADIDARINEILSQRFAKANISAERVLTELSRIAFSDPRDLFDPDTGQVLGIHHISDDAAATVSRMEVEIFSTGQGENKELHVVKKIRQHDKMAALSLLARHFKIVGDVDDGVDALANALADRMKRGRERAAAAALKDIEDAVILPHARAAEGARLEYGVPGDTSNANDVTSPALALESPEPDSIALHSGPARPVCVVAPPPDSMEDDDEDLA